MDEKHVDDSVNTKSINEKLKSLDKESATVEYTGIWGKLIAALCICFSLFQIYTGFFGAFDAMIQRCVHLSFGISLVFLLCPTKKAWIRGGKVNPLDLGLAILAAIPPIYILVNYQSLILRAGTVTTTDFIIGLLGIVMVLEAARRIVGTSIVAVVILFLAYGYFGPYMPGPLAHRGLSLEQMVSHLFYTTEGVFGIPLGVSSTFIFLFILFGAYLEKTGLGKFFIDIANAIAGWASGGPAKVAVISSALQGTISGSSVANVVGSGSFTIPMMKKLGYKKDFAGAVEAAASTGGQLMPPIMGAAAFLMAEFVGVPYMEVVKAAVVPAILYFIGVFLGVHFEAKKENLVGTPRSKLPSARAIMHEEGHLAIPLLAIIGLLASGYTPMKAALGGIVISIATAMLRENTRMTFGDIVDGLIKGARGALGVLMACAAAGMIIAGAAISGGDPLKTGVNASKLGIAAFIVPYVFVLSPALLGIHASAGQVIMTTITALIGMVGISSAMIGYLYRRLNAIERLIIFAAGLCLIDPESFTDLVGIGVMIALVAFQYFRSRKVNA